MVAASVKPRGNVALVHEKAYAALRQPNGYFVLGQKAWQISCILKYVNDKAIGAYKRTAKVTPHSTKVSTVLARELESQLTLKFIDFLRRCAYHEPPLCGSPPTELQRHLVRDHDCRRCGDLLVGREYRRDSIFRVLGTGTASPIEISALHHSA